MVSLSGLLHFTPVVFIPCFLLSDSSGGLINTNEVFDAGCELLFALVLSVLFCYCLRYSLLYIYTL